MEIAPSIGLFKMKEKFIYPLLAILLAIISTNVSAVTTATNGTSNKTLYFSWQGSIDLINSKFDWKFTNADGSDYIPLKNTNLDMGRKGVTNNTSEDVIISGDPMYFFIVPVSVTPVNILNSVGASVSAMPTIAGLNSDAADIFYGDTPNENKNQVSILMNDNQIEFDVVTPVPPPIEANYINSYPVKIALKSQIIGADYTNGNIIQISVPVIFSVKVQAL